MQEEPEHTRNVLGHCWGTESRTTIGGNVDLTLLSVDSLFKQTNKKSIRKHWT